MMHYVYWSELSQEIEPIQNILTEFNPNNF